MSTAGGLVRRGGAADRSNPWTRLPGAVRATPLRRGDCFDVRPAARAQLRCGRIGFRLSWSRLRFRCRRQGHIDLGSQHRRCLRGCMDFRLTPRPGREGTMQSAGAAPTAPATFARGQTELRARPPARRRFRPRAPRAARRAAHRCGSPQTGECPRLEIRRYRVPRQ